MDVKAAPQVETSVSGTDGRGALPNFWYILYVRVNSEAKAENYIGRLGYKTFVAAQDELHQWSDRKRVVRHIVIPMVVFVKLPPSALAEVERLSFATCFLRVPGQRKLATLPDEKLEEFRFMLENASGRVTFCPGEVGVGDSIIITRGRLKGLTGSVMKKADGSTEVMVMLDYLGCAKVSVELSDIRKT